MSDTNDNWRDWAVCQDEVDLFNTTFEQSYPPGAEDTAATTEARKVCACCTVVNDCLLWALTVQTEYGMWGGLTPLERESFAPMMRRERFDTQAFETGQDAIPVKLKAS